MGIEVEIQGGEKLLRTLDQLAPNKLHQAVAAASKRAATAARTAGTKQLRGIYTIRSSDLKARAQIRKLDDGCMIDIKGSTEPVQKFKAQKRRAGIFVSIKRGSGGIAARSFDLSGRFVAREGKDRYPVKGLYGPSVPQLFENPEVLSAMEKRASEMFETRLEHEIDRLLGG